MPEVVLPWSRLSPGTLARVLGLDLALALLEAGWHLEGMRRSGASVRAQVELNLGRRGFVTTTARGTATLELVLQPEGYSMASTCTCMAWSQPCLHVAALLLDLVADAPLRERLERGEPIPADLGNPDARRAALQAELQVLQAVTVWSPPLAAGDAGPVELLVSVVDPRIDAARMASTSAGWSPAVKDRSASRSPATS